MNGILTFDGSALCTLFYFSGDLKKKKCIYNNNVEVFVMLETFFSDDLLGLLFPG